MRVAFFTPLPPTKSGIADYSLEILPELAERFEIDVFTESRESIAFPITGASVFNHRDFDWRDVLKPYDRIVYQLGNNVCHDFMINHIYLHPGILVLHDWNLHRFRAFSLLARGAGSAYVEEMEYCHGLKGKQVAHLTAQGYPSELLFHFYPLNKIVIEASIAVAVHNQWAATQIQRDHPSTPVHVIASPFTPPPMPPDRDRIRAVRSKYGIQPDEIMAASFGVVSVSKGIPGIFKALRELKANGLKLKYVLVGEAATRFVPEELVAQFDVADMVSITGYVSSQEFTALMAATDIALNLRYPTQGETSAVLLKLMGLGKPCIVPDYRQFREIPKDACRHISLGRKFADELKDAISSLTESADLRSTMGEMARRFVASAHNRSATIEQYTALIRQNPRSDKRNTPSVIALGLKSCPDVAEDLRQELGRLCGMMKSGDAPVLPSVLNRFDSLIK